MIIFDQRYHVSEFLSVYQKWIKVGVSRSLATGMSDEHDVTYCRDADIIYEKLAENMIEISLWIYENINSEYIAFSMYEHAFFIKNECDAMAFKLRWM